MRTKLFIKFRLKNTALIGELWILIYILWDYNWKESSISSIDLYQFFMIQFSSYFCIENTSVILCEIYLFLYKPYHTFILWRVLLFLVLYHSELYWLPFHPLLLRYRPLEYFYVLFQFIFRLRDVVFPSFEINKIPHFIEDGRLPVLLIGIGVVYFGGGQDGECLVVDFAGVQGLWLFLLIFEGRSLKQCSVTLPFWRGATFFLMRDIMAKLFFSLHILSFFSITNCSIIILQMPKTILPSNIQKI